MRQQQQDFACLLFNAMRYSTCLTSLFSLEKDKKATGTIFRFSSENALFVAFQGLDSPVAGGGLFV